MDRAEALFAALRARVAFTGTPQLDKTQVEALAEAMEVSAPDLPALVAQLQARTPPAVELIWGGSLRVLQQPSYAPGGSVIMNVQGSTFGPGSAIAGGSAQGGAATIGTDINSAIGALANVIAALSALRPTLQGEAAHAAAQVEQALRDRPAHDAPVETKKTWAEQAMGGLSALLKAAPEVKDLVEVGGEVVKLLS